jgi:hypothetical protein
MNELFTVWNNDYPGYERQQTSEQTLKDSKEMREGYFQTYKNPAVIYIRTALNIYLNGDLNNLLPKSAKEKKESNDLIYGLDSFNKSYYKSKFVVIYYDTAPFGGQNITILFQDKPDRFFTTWVYKLADKTYELRGFWAKKQDNPEDIKKINTEFKEFLMDKEHAM